MPCRVDRSTGSGRLINMQTMKNGYCDQCGEDREVTDAGSAMGFASRFWWVTYECGHTDMDGDQPDP